MGDHELFEPATPVEPPRDVSRVVEVKVVVSTAVTLVVSVVVAWLNAIQDSPGLIAGWPSWAQFLFLTAIPPLLAGLAGYWKASNRV